MTVIAYRDGVMACDSLWEDRRVITALRSKIKRLRSGALYGGAGDADDRALVTLLEDANSPDAIPTFETLRDIKQDLQALIIFPDGAAWKVSTGKDAEAYQVDEMCAIGAGADFALTAMYLGETAKEAVETACALTSACKLPIHVLTLNPQLQEYV